MARKKDPNFQGKEQTFLFTKESLSVVRKEDMELKSSDFQSNTTRADTLPNETSALDDIPVPGNTDIEITLWNNRNFYITKALIPLRIAMFFWFASGSLCSAFFSLLLTHRGLTLTEFSSVFSVLFLFQSAVSYICGIIADKLGNAKPVLLFLMLGTTFVLICLLLAPEVNAESCLEDNKDVACFTTFNYTIYLEYCKSTCSKNINNYLIAVAENNNKNESFASVELTNDLNINETFENAFFSNDTHVFCKDICFCFDHYAAQCSFSSKIGFEILYSILTIFYFSFWTTTHSFLDFASLNLAKQYNSDLGKERFFGFSGALVSTFLCNFVLRIDKTGTREHYGNVFWFAVVLYIVSVVSASKTSVVPLPPGLNFTKKTLQLLTNIEIMSIICVSFVSGTAFTFNSFFHLWFLDNLKASTTIIGIHLMTSSLYSLPIHLTSKWWLKTLGRKTIFIISLLGYTINGFCYSFLYYPWLSLIIQITRPFSYHLFWFTVTVYCREVAPEGFAATLNAIIGIVHSGIGRSFSISIGGYLMSVYGARTTFRILAGFCFITFILYSTFLYLRVSFHKKDREKRSTNPEEVKSMRENEA